MLLVTFSPIIGLATPAPPIEESTQRIQLAQKSISNSLLLIKEKKYAEAAEQLDLSYRTYPSNQALHLLGRLYDKIPTECVRSIAAWKMLVDRCDTHCNLRTDALSKLKTAEMECEGNLEIKSAPRSAEVFVNNRKVGVTPLILPTIARVQNLTLLKEGYHPIDQQVELKRGWSSNEITVQLKSNKKIRGIGGTAAPSEHATKVNKLASIEVKTPQDRESLKTSLPSIIDEKIDSKPSWHVKFTVNEDPFTRLATLPHINKGKIAISGEHTIITRLTCEYRSKFQRYLPLDGCDGSRIAPYDRFFISILAQQDSYIYLVMSNDKNQWQLLFPEKGESNLFKANELASIPKKEWILFDEMRHTIDVISIIAAPKPIPELESEKGRSSSKGLSTDVMKYFVPMGKPYSKQPIKNSRILKEQTKYVLDHPQVLHTSFEVYR